MRRSARKKVEGVKKFNKLYRSKFKFQHHLRVLKNIMFSFGHCPNYLVSDFYIEWVFQKISFKNTRVYVICGLQPLDPSARGAQIKS